MSLFVKNLLDQIQRQIIDHKQADAKQQTHTAVENRHNILDKNNPINATFPWLCAAFVKELVGGDGDDSAIPPGVLNAVYLYKIMDHLSTGKGFRTYLGVMRRNDLWCNIRTYGFGELKNTSYLAHKEAKALSITTGNRFFDDLITCFKTLAGFYIVTGHVKSTPLHNFIKVQQRFNDKELRFYAEELVCAVGYLHSVGIIHRDLTAANIKVTSEGHIKVFNLHNAHIALDEDGNVENDPQVEGIVGLDAYLCPEMIDLKLHGYAVDWWCLGVVLYFMMNGKLPFRGDTKRALFLNIKYGQPKYEEGLHDAVTHDLIKTLLEKKPKKRLGFKGTKEVKQHAYFKSTYWYKVENGMNTPPLLPITSAVTSLPPELCLSLEHLDDSEPPVKKCTSRRDVEQMASQNLAPDNFYEFELRHDWSTYVHPDIPIEEAIHYVHSELKPPMYEDEGLPLEQSITKVPELSNEEKRLFQQYLGIGNVEQTYIDKVRIDDNRFMMMSDESRRQLDSDPVVFFADVLTEDSGDGSRMDLITDDDISLPSLHEASIAWSSKSSAKHDTLALPVAEDNHSNASVKSTLGIQVNKLKDFMVMDKVKFWKRRGSKSPTTVSKKSQ